MVLYVYLLMIIMVSLEAIFAPHIISEYYAASRQISTKFYDKLLEAFN